MFKLNTCYKIFTGMIGNYMQEHAARNDILDKSQLGTCSRVLGTVDQLIIDRAIMDEVKGQQRNLAVAFYDYQKAYDMVRHDWMIRVYQWMGAPEKLIEFVKELMKRWKTKLEVTENKKQIVSRLSNVTRGFLQGDSFSPMLVQGSDGYKWGKVGTEWLKERIVSL